MIRNLIYHVTPFVWTNAWRKNLTQLRRRMDVFDGRKVVAIATGRNMARPAVVRDELGGLGVEFIEVENSRTLRERASFVTLLEAVESTRSDEATFYAHAKGVIPSGDPKAVMFWRNAMYVALLDDPGAVKDALLDHPFVGAFRMQGQSVFPDKIETDWHFAGAFYWFRHDFVFGDSDWRDRIPESGWACEAWPALVCPYGSSACLYDDEPDGNPYSIRTHRNDPKFYDAPDGWPTLDLKVELGGGKNPREGFLNVDRIDEADIKRELDEPHMWLPFEDERVAELYSAHCLEHLMDIRPLLREVARVCRLGAAVEFRVPHWLSSMAMCHDHKHTISEVQVAHWSQFKDYWWGESPRRLNHLRTERIQSEAFAEVQTLFPSMTPDQVMRFVPDTCHELRFHFEVVENR